MRKSDYRKVIQFRNDLKDYQYLVARLEQLRGKESEFLGSMGPHSPSLSGSHGVPEPHDQKLARMITKKAELDNEIKLTEARVKRTRTILKYMPKNYVEALLKMYGGHCNQEAAAEMAGVSNTVQFWRNVNKYILEAINNYEKRILGIDD